MPATLPAYEIRAAYCTISNRSVFLQDLQKIASEHNTRIICFNADMIAGKAHAACAVALALRAFEAGKNISNTLEMEALLFAAGSRQCNVATGFGIQEGENRLYVCCLPESEETRAALDSRFRFVQEDWDTIGPDKRAVLMETFDISSDEIIAAGGDSRIVDLVLERVALLQVLR
jgi:KEOPS complex subunit Cgi121